MAGPNPSLDMVSCGSVFASPTQVLFRDPKTFVAGEIHRHLPQWQWVLEDYPKRQEIYDYISHGVKVSDFFVHFKGEFQGNFYNLPFPPAAIFPNSKVCEQFEDFISATILERVSNGSLSIWGKIGEVAPPHLVMPITVEPSKPRMCHDERFLNLWIKDLPLSLDYISNLPRYVSHGHFQSVFDDKSGYDHVLLSPESTTYFGLAWKGWFFTYKTIPFGWKASAYIYHNIGMAATNRIRLFNVPCSQYIDDRHVGQLRLHQSSHSQWSNLQLAQAGAYIACTILVSLGYFIGLNKCVILPQKIVRFLGFLCDSDLQAFVLPEDKKEKFANLRESVLCQRSVSVKSLQRLAGKIISFCIAVPAAKLYAREIYRAIAKATRSSRPIKLVGDLKAEIEYWRFLDSWNQSLPWLDERHLVVKLSSDASLFAWGGVVENLGGPPLECHGRWSDSDSSKSIATKEALALAFTIQSASAVVKNCRLDAHVDSMALIQSWERQGGKSKELNDVLKVLYHSMLRQNVSFDLKYIPSAHNPADALSRVLSDKDCMLASDGWATLESLFGPHSIDLMALDANAQPDSSGTPLKHFTPFASPASHGVNLFAQHLSCAENAYVFPPFVMVGPVLRFLGNATFTIVVPKLTPIPYWWPILQARATQCVTLGRKGDMGVLLFPTAQGSFRTRPLQWDLLAFRIVPNLDSVAF